MTKEIKQRPFIPLTEEEYNFLKKEYYDKLLFFGVSKLFKYMKDNYTEHSFTRRQIESFLKQQKNYQQFKQTKKQKDTRQIKSNAPNNIVSMDLIEMFSFQHKGHNYILNIIDNNSRYAWAYPLKNKEVKSVERALTHFLKNNTSPKVFFSDNGNEFKGLKNFLSNYNIKQLFTKPHHPWENITERFNKTMKTMIFKTFSSTKKYNWLDFLPDIIKNYNNTYHTSIKMTPAEAYNQTEEEVKEMNEKIKSKRQQNFNNRDNTDLKIGDTVLLKKVDKSKNKKGDSLWQDEPFTIIKVVKPKNETSITRFKLKGKQGLYNASFLQKITKRDTPDTEEIEEPVRITKTDRARLNELNREIITKPKRKKRTKKINYKEEDEK